MRTLSRFSIALAALAACGVTAAAADESTPTDGPTFGATAYPIQDVDRPIVLPVGLGQADGDLGIDLSKGNAFEGIGLAGGATYGLMPRLDLGAHAILQLKPGGNTFRGLDVHGQYELLGHWLVGRGDLLINHNPGKTQFGLGFGLPIKKKLTAQFAVSALDTVVRVYFDPTVKFLDLPFALHFQAMPKLAVLLKSGISLPDFKSANLVLPLTLDGQYTVSPRFDVGMAFTLTNLHPPAGVGSTDGRALDLYAKIRF